MCLDVIFIENLQTSFWAKYFSKQNKVIQSVVHSSIHVVCTYPCLVPLYFFICFWLFRLFLVISLLGFLLHCYRKYSANWHPWLRGDPVCISAAVSEPLLEMEKSCPWKEVRLLIRAIFMSIHINRLVGTNESNISLPHLVSLYE